MAVGLTQRKAKVLIRDYLRETRRKGVTSLMRDMSKVIGKPIFTQRTFELWLKEQARQLNDHNWSMVQTFVHSNEFKRFVPYANEGPADQRLKQVAEGFIALYGHAVRPSGLSILPSEIERIGADAIAHLDGQWENNPNQYQRDVPRVICKITSIQGERYAKFAYIALFRSKQISATGLVIYLNSNDREDSDYSHNFILQLWRRRDPESDSKMPGALIYLTLEKNQPQFSISSRINRYFYKEPVPLGAQGDFLHALDSDLESARYKKTGSYSKVNQFDWGLDVSNDNSVTLKRAKDIFPEEEQIIDQLLEDVLPHGYAEA